jgi:hypothetical protein
MYSVGGGLLKHYSFRSFVSDTINNKNEATSESSSSIVKESLRTHF